MSKTKIEIVNDLLGYEGLKIIQRPDVFNFSLDSTLLADFVTINKGDKKIIDLGCGNGYIPIFLTLRTGAHITGVEIQTEIYDLAKRSVELNNLTEQVKIINGDMKDIYHQVGIAQFDVVTCNPPYFVETSSSNKNVSEYLRIARHEITITLQEVCHIANVLLKDGGTFALVHRCERLLDVLESLRSNGFEPKRMQFIYPKVNSDNALCLLVEAKKSPKKGGLKILKPQYVMDENNQYTSEILKIFNYQKEGI